MFLHAIKNIAGEYHYFNLYLHDVNDETTGNDIYRLLEAIDHQELQKCMETA